tara:strand:+ start:16131 stop:16433 length:303 start_codon:yes stop_codon:yes gene_type:complete
MSNRDLMIDDMITLLDGKVEKREVIVESKYEDGFNGDGSGATEHESTGEELNDPIYELKTLVISNTEHFQDRLADGMNNVSLEAVVDVFNQLSALAMKIK